MAREYRIECGDSIDRTIALEMLAKSPYFHRPSPPSYIGEFRLSTYPRPNHLEVRLFPEPYGFFLEVTSLPSEMAKSLESWFAGLRSLGKCTIIDNDTEEEVEIVR
jgi:hypothetical protein